MCVPSALMAGNSARSRVIWLSVFVVVSKRKIVGLFVGLVPSGSCLEVKAIRVPSASIDGCSLWS